MNYTTITRTCKHCDGEGTVTKNNTVWSNFQVYPEWADCPCDVCDGEGTVEVDVLVDDLEEAA